MPEKETEILSQVPPDIRRRALEQWFVELNAMNIQLQKIMKEMQSMGRVFLPDEALPLALKCVHNELRGIQEQLHGPQIVKAQSIIQ